MIYDVVNLEQGSQEWVEFRKTRLGGSDAATVMGENPYSNPQKLWEEKRGLRTVFVNDAMKRGTKLEPAARDMFERVYNTIITPIVIVSKAFPFLMASLDGMNDEMILEIKCPGEKMHLMAKKNGVPPHYYAQMQHAMMISGRKTTLFMSYRDDEDFFFHTCDRDEDYISKMLAKEIEFHEWMLKEDLSVKVQNDEVSDDDAELLTMYRAANQKKMLWEKTCKELKEEIIAKFQKPIKANGVSLTERVLQGRIEYDNIPQLQGVDLSKYRKPDTKSWVIKTYE